MTKTSQIEFTKMVASGNDFVIIDAMRYALCAMRWNDLVKKICDRKYGVGADGLLLLEKSKVADVRMRIFNADGSEAEMCGNGARCVAYWQSAKRKALSAKLKIETKAGIIESEVKGENVKIKLTVPKDMKVGIPIMVNSRVLKVNFINTGVPHTVIFVEGLEKIDVDGLGRIIRYHENFKPAGTNVNFVEVKGDNSIKVRTYERGVEAETLACGTGSVASALIAAHNLQPIASSDKTDVLTKSGEILKVYFNKIGDKFSDVWLEGKAKIVYEGRIATADGADKDRR
ncbi:MAG: diaminopimelate epimerase [Candidatus Omnitrophota bacterium]|nr:diaminopimelate epimerase [Candidatus Omnitrophota bacterium]